MCVCVCVSFYFYIADFVRFILCKEMAIEGLIVKQETIFGQLTKLPNME